MIFLSGLKISNLTSFPIFMINQNIYEKKLRSFYSEYLWFYFEMDFQKPENYSFNDL